MTEHPYIINSSKIGNPKQGFLVVADIVHNIPFEIKRTFWTYGTPPTIVRGGHAHFETEMVLFALTGTITVVLENTKQEKATFLISQPTMGLYIPVMHWHTMTYSEDSVQLVLASTIYDESDYIRDYKNWRTQC